MTSIFKKKSVELESLTSIDMLKMVVKRNQRWIHHAVHRYAKTNNEHMKDYNKKRIMISNILLRKQFIRIGNVSEITCR